MKSHIPTLFNLQNTNLNASQYEINATGTNFSDRKISQKQLSKLMQFILTNIGNGIERGELVERYYNLPRRYCGYFTDPCYQGKAKREFERRFRRAQPAITKTLQRLQRRGLITLHRHGKVVKKISLTPEGNAVVQLLQEKST